MKNRQESRPLILSLYDCWDALKHGKKILFYSALLVGAFFLLYKVTKPLSYTAEGVFKGNSPSAQASNGLAKALEGVFDIKWEHFIQPEDPKMFFLTPPVLVEAITALNLQGHISFPQKNGLFKRVWNNLKTEAVLLFFAKRTHPPSEILHESIAVPGHVLFPSPQHFLHFESATYEGETYASCSIEFEDDEHFIFFNREREKIASGTLGVPVKWNSGSFILKKSQNISLRSRRFEVTWIPLSQAVMSLAKSIKVTRDKNNPSLVAIRYTHQNRQFASKIVNALMEGYQIYLQKQGEKKISKQLKYLSSRQGEMEKQLDVSLEQHRRSIEECLGKGHFLSLEEEVEFLAKTQSECQERLVKLTTEIQRLSGQHDNNFEELFSETIEEGVNEENPPLQNALDLLMSTQMEFEKATLAKQKYDEMLQKLQDPATDLPSLVSACDEPSLQPLFSQVCALSIKLLDEDNWTPKEKERMRKELETHRQFLCFHLSRLKEGSVVSEEAFLMKIEALKKTCMLSLLNEYTLLKRKMEQNAISSLEFAEKWLAEKKIDLNTTLYSSIVESISMLIEAKNIAYHTECIDAAPFISADPPVMPNPPHLGLSFLIGFFAGGGLALCFLLGKVIYRGANASIDNLNALGNISIGQFSSYPLPSLSHISSHDELILFKLARQLFQHQEPCVVLCGSKGDMSFLKPLIELFSKRGEKILWVSLESPLEPGLFSALEQGRTPSIVPFDDYDFLPGGELTLSAKILLHAPFFDHLVTQWKKTYRWIFIEKHCSGQDDCFCSLIPFATQTVFQITDETVTDISFLPSQTLYLHSLPLWTHSSSYLSLDEISPLLEKLKKNLYKAYSLAITRTKETDDKGNF